MAVVPRRLLLLSGLVCKSNRALQIHWRFGEILVERWSLDTSEVVFYPKEHLPYQQSSSRFDFSLWAAFLSLSRWQRQLETETNKRNQSVESVNVVCKSFCTGKPDEAFLCSFLRPRPCDKGLYFCWVFRLT